jgi:hypothetical protein
MTPGYGRHMSTDPDDPTPREPDPDAPGTYVDDPDAEEVAEPNEPA